MANKLRLAIAVLAAGNSIRFGNADKLTAQLRGKALALHATDTLKAMEACNKWVVVAQSGHTLSSAWDEAGFAEILNPDAHLGMGSSVALAATLARQAEAHALLICLADMPLVPKSHYEAVVNRTIGSDSHSIVASFNGSSVLPPACFRSERFDELACLDGDSGARALLAGAIRIKCKPELLIDVDDPQTLARLQAG